MNLGGALRVRVSNASAGTLLDEVNALLEKAIEQRSSYVKLADRAARLYAPVVHLTALATFLGWIAWGIISIWFLYRIVRGMVAMNAGQAVGVNG